MCAAVRQQADRQQLCQPDELRQPDELHAGLEALLLREVAACAEEQRECG